MVRDVFDALNVLQIAIGFQNECGSIGIDFTGRQNDVLRLQVAENLVDLDTHRREFSGVDFKPDPFLLLAIEKNPADSIERVEFFAQLIGCIADFCIVETFAGDGNGSDRDAAVVSVDERSARSRGKFVLDIVHLVADVLKDGVNICFRNGVSYLQFDDGAACADQRIDVIDLGDLARLPFNRNHDKIFHPIRSHAGKLCGDHRSANRD